MIRVASLDLCLELRSLTGWEAEEDDFVYVQYGNEQNPAPTLKRELLRSNGTLNPSPDVLITPAYDFDYLVGEILLVVANVRFRLHAGKIYATAPNHWRFEADTPADAACKFVIKLIKDGKIK